MQTSLQRIHPLVAAASVSIILVSMLGVATITGVLPQSNSQTTAGNGVGKALPAAVGVGTAKPAAGTSAAYLVARPAPVAAGSSLRPLTVRDTLAPGETLIATVPAAPPVVAAPAAPAGASNAVTGARAPAASMRPEPVVTAVPAVGTGPLAAATPMPPISPTVKPAVRPDAAARASVKPERAAGTDARPVVLNAAPHANVARLYDRQEIRTSGMSAGSEYASGAPTVHDGMRDGVREKRRRAMPDPQALATLDLTRAEPQPQQRIVPVYRDQRAPGAATAVSSAPATAGEAFGSEQAVPVYPQVVMRDAAPVPYRRAGRGGADSRGEAARVNDSADGPATRFGATLGRTLGDGIDRTISVIADVLSGVGTGTPASPRDAYGSVPGER